MLVALSADMEGVSQLDDWRAIFAFEPAYWREGRAPSGSGAKAWIPPDEMKGDVLKERIDGINRLQDGLEWRACGADNR